MYRREGIRKGELREERSVYRSEGGKEGRMSEEKKRCVMQEERKGEEKRKTDGAEACHVL